MIQYTKLKLSRDQYDNLTNDSGIRQKKVIVFQFTYMKQDDPYPTLWAYAMRKKHQEIKTSISVPLEYASMPPATDLSVDTEQVTGDLQIFYDELQTLKKESNPKDPEDYQYLLFTPIFESSNQHVYFKVTVFPSTAGIKPLTATYINPSPPYGAS